eukprot:1029225-Pelagomonas_calceolata.AAC.2
MEVRAIASTYPQVALPHPDPYRPPIGPFPLTMGRATQNVLGRVGLGNFREVPCHTLPPTWPQDPLKCIPG